LKIMITKIIATIGRKIEAKDITTAPPVSTVETTGFPSPAVLTEEVNRVPALALFTILAVPPPAIMAKAQVIIGERSAMVETITAVPAMADSGMAISSKALATKGI